VTAQNVHSVVALVAALQEILADADEAELCAQLAELHDSMGCVTQNPENVSSAPALHANIVDASRFVQIYAQLDALATEPPNSVQFLHRCKHLREALLELGIGKRKVKDTAARRWGAPRWITRFEKFFRRSQTSRCLTAVRQELSSRRTAAKMEDDQRQQHLRQRNEEQRQRNEENQRRAVQDDAWWQEEQQMQERLLATQDDGLIEIHNRIVSMNQIAYTFDRETQGDNKTIEELDDAMDIEAGKMHAFVGGVGTPLQTKKWWQIYAVMLLILLLVCLLALFILWDAASAVPPQLQ